MLFRIFFFFLIFPAFLCAETIKIGLILPLSGAMANVGAAGRDAALMALEDVKGKTRNDYELIIEDDRLSTEPAAREAQKLIHRDKVSAIVSTWSYGGQIVSPLAAKAGVPHIGVAWDATIADGDSNFLHLTPPEEFMRAFLEAFQKLGIKKVALLGIEESGSVYALDVFERLATEYGVDVIFRDSLLWEGVDFRSVVSRIAQEKPEYLLFNFGGDAYTENLLKQMKIQKVEFPFTAITAFDTVSNPGLIEGIWYVSDSYLPDDFAARFEKRYGHAIRYGVGNFYEALRLLQKAFDESEDASAAEAIKKLREVKNLDSVFGATSVDERGVFRYPPRYMMVRDGKREMISLEDIVE